MKTLKREEIHANDYRDLEHCAPTSRSSSSTITIAAGCIRRWAISRRRSSSKPRNARQSRGATMSFFRHREIYRSDGIDKGSRPKPAPRTIVSMSLRLVIPWRVGLHQSPPPLHQPRTILKEMRQFEKVKSLNGKCRNRVVSA